MKAGIYFCSARSCMLFPLILLRKMLYCLNEICLKNELKSADETLVCDHSNESC